MTENVNKKKYIIIGVIAVLIVSIVGTLAWYTFGTKKSSLVLVLGNSDELLITLSPYELNIVAAPVTNYTSMTDYVSVTATNSKTISTSFSFFYDIETIDSALASTAMKYAVTRSSTQGGTYTEVATGSFNGSTAGQHKVIYTENVPATTTYYYKIYTYLDGNSSNSNMEGKVLKTTMGADLNYYTVTFNANGGTVPISTMSVGYGSTYGNMPTPSKTNATFLGWSLLPSGYRQVEYIESTGSQSINTGIASSNNITANVDAVFPNSGSSSQLLLCSCSNAGCWAGQYGGYYSIGTTTEFRLSACNVRKTLKITFDSSGVSMEIDGSSVTRSGTHSNGNNYYLFSTPTGTFYTYARIYKATIYSEAGAVLADFIPALNTSTNKYGLYDLHNSSFNANVSSGGVDFTPGDYSYVTSSTIVTQPSNHTLYAVWG